MYRDKTAEWLYMPGGAMKAYRLHHTLVVSDLSWDRNGLRLTAVTAIESNSPAVGIKDGVKDVHRRTSENI